MNLPEIEAPPEISPKSQINQNHKTSSLSGTTEMKDTGSSVNIDPGTSDSSQFYKELSALQIYLQTFAQLGQLEHFSITLKQKYKLANKTSQKAQSAKLAIIKYKKAELGKAKVVSLSKILFSQELENKQALYRKEINKLQELQTDIEFIKHQFNQERIRVLTKFINWYLECYKEPITAMSVNQINEAIMKVLTGSTYCSSSEEDEAKAMEEEKPNTDENMLSSSKSSENSSHTVRANANFEGANNTLSSAPQSTGQKEPGNAPVPLYDNHLNLPLDELDALKKLHDMIFKQQRIGVRDITQLTSTSPYHAVLAESKSDTQSPKPIAYIDLDGEKSNLSQSQSGTSLNNFNKNKESISGGSHSGITNQIQNLPSISSYLPGQVNVPYSNYNYNYAPVNNNYQPPKFGCPESVSNGKFSFPSPHLAPSASYHNKRKRVMVNQGQNIPFVQPTIAEQPFRNYDYNRRGLPTPPPYPFHISQCGTPGLDFVMNLPTYNPPTLPSPVTNEEEQVYGSPTEFTQQNNTVNFPRNVVAPPSNHPQASTRFLNTNPQPDTTSEAIDLSQIANIPLTGDKEVDEEIIKFYHSRYNLN